MPPVVLVAPSAFKGTFGPRAVAEAFASGVHRAVPDARVLTCPVADGGDGLLDAVLAPGALRERVTVSGPLGTPVNAELGWIDAETALFESATACGLALVAPAERDPLRATTRGVGELLWEAMDRGAKTVIIGLGGSATVDGGTGAARGLGWMFANEAGEPLPEGGGGLVNLGDFGGGWGVAARVLALADVQTPLIEAAEVFAPQKGASPEQVRLLAHGLERLNALFARHGRADLGTLPMGGAAGGLGAGLAYFAKAELVAGARWTLERVGFDAALAKADLVLTGEGVMDPTSHLGKAVGEVLRRARDARKHVAVVAGAARDATTVPVFAGDGAPLDAAGLAALAEQATRAVLGLPRP